MTQIPGIGSLSTPLLDAAGGGLKDATGTAGAGKPAGGFANMISDQLTKLNESQGQANKVADDLATGRVDDVAQAMLSVEKANVQLQYATQLRNKGIEAYQEILRMQV
jgi:flagellar hook-basal body complex protein FliE